MVSRGGAEPGEITATCARIVDGDDASWSTEWCATADRVADRAEESRGAGHAVSAREAYLRASIYYGLANRPLFGRPVDGRLVDAFARQRAAFERAIALLDRPAESVRGRPGRRDGSRLVLPAPATCAGAAAPPHERLRRRDAGTVPVGDRGPASRLPRRGLRRPGSRPHARGAGRAAARRLGVDREPGARHAARTPRRRCRSRRAHGLEPRRATSRCVPRAATTGSRPASPTPASTASAKACWPGCSSSKCPSRCSPAFPTSRTTCSRAMEQFVDSSRFLHWTLKQRGFWTHGVDSLAELREGRSTTSRMEGRLADIHCSTLVTAAESDPLSASAAQVVEEISGAHAELVRLHRRRRRRRPLRMAESVALRPGRLRLARRGSASISQERSRLAPEESARSGAAALPL